MASGKKTAKSATANDLPHHTMSVSRREVLLEEKDRGALEELLTLLRTRTGHDFSLYKKSALFRRIERRMEIHRIDRIAGYLRFLRENSQEVELLFRELLIGVTSFFRDPAPWKQLRDEVLPKLLASRSGGVVRAWSAGCSTGEEAYSLAMAFLEAMERLEPRESIRLQIFATDLDCEAVDTARRGFYPANITADVSPERLRRFFVKEGNGYRIGREIREMVTFATQNVIMDPPFTRIDILVCRNLLIYLTPELQKKLLPLFHYSLTRDGVLFLGSADTTGSFNDLFAPLDVKSRLFRRRESAPHVKPVAFPILSYPSRPGVAKEATMLKPAANLQSLAEQLLLRHFSPPAVLVNAEGDILYVNGRTGKYLEPAAGKANWNIFAMAREGLSFDLGNAFRKAVRKNETVTVKRAKVGVNGGTQTVDITVQAIEQPEALRGMTMIVFHDVDTLPGRKTRRRSRPGAEDNARIIELERELQRSRDELQTSREEMQSSREELKSVNEELQSTNEELTTSREEMQSLNEELQAASTEQQSRMDELGRMNNDMRNLLDSTEIITLFLDGELHVRRFTTRANKLFRLIPEDAGRPLSDIANDLVYPGMIDEAREVLRTLVFAEREVATTDGRWYQVRIMPCRTMDDVIGGVVLTFSDITASKKLETELREEISRLRRSAQGLIRQPPQPDRQRAMS